MSRLFRFSSKRPSCRRPFSCLIVILKYFLQIWFLLTFVNVAMFSFEKPNLLLSTNPNFSLCLLSFLKVLHSVVLLNVAALLIYRKTGNRVDCTQLVNNLSHSGIINARVSSNFLKSFSQGCRRVCLIH